MSDSLVRLDRLYECLSESFDLVNGLRDDVGVPEESRSYIDKQIGYKTWELLQSVGRTRWHVRKSLGVDGDA